MKKREKAIEEFLSKPIAIGDWIKVIGIEYKKDKPTSCEVKSINEDGTFLVEEMNENSKPFTINLDQVTQRELFKVGSDNFKRSTSRLRMVNFSLESILHSMGYERNKRVLRTDRLDDVEIDELNWNPIIVDIGNNIIPYQRGFVWSLEDKQLLIESIYQGLDIGKIIIKKNSFGYIREQINIGKKVAFKDIVDGKQRLNALLGFVMDEFEDLHGNLFSDLSDKAKHKFQSFQGVSYGELDEETTDKEIQETFMKINFTGVQMTKEHLDFVKNINCK